MIHKQPGHLRISQAKEVDSSVLLVVFFLSLKGQLEMGPQRYSKLQYEI